MKNCKEDKIILHEQEWPSKPLCTDGGIFRAKNTYTNLDASGFKTDIGYSGHFYGIRKYTNLIPQAPYYVHVVGQTGSNETIELPTEYTENEYGIDNCVNYSNTKIVAFDRSPHDNFGKSVAIKKDLMCIGAPHTTLQYQEISSNNNVINYELKDAGAIYVYRRNPRPSGYSWPDCEQKSSWVIEDKIVLPSGLRKDFYDTKQLNRIGDFFVQEPLAIIQKQWNVGQEGRNLGHSLDVAMSYDHQSFQEDSRQIIVAGGPTASWHREFGDVKTSGVPVAIMYFTDEFVPEIVYGNSFKTFIDNAQTVLNFLAQRKNLLFTYFADPPIHIDLKVIICEPIKNLDDVIVKEFPEPKPDFIVKKQINRVLGKKTAEQNEIIFSGIKDAFHEAFPYDTNKIHNNIPPIVGFFVDTSASMRNALGDAGKMFQNYYLNYSFASGLKDFFGTRASGAFVFPKELQGDPEGWVQTTCQIIDQVLNPERLITEGQVKYLTSGIGQEFFNENISAFNLPPESGGRVYVFEKESGSWNLIQEIKSSKPSYGTPDRFGHSVSISEDTEVIAIGSPYTGECCKVYEYKPEEKNRLYDGLYSWLKYKNSATGGLIAKYRNLLLDYDLWIQKYPSSYANEILYSKLDSTDKFDARRYLDIQEYQNIYTYSYGDIPFICSNWEFIPENFASTSRLGYSSAVNEDGTIVAFGAPTDSFNEWEDGNVWYKNRGYSDPNDTDSLNTISISPSWINSANAGAVRLFESRKYYPHNTVVEFGKFGNLQQSMNFPEDSGHFNYLATAFNDMNFKKTAFTDVKIPQEAGLAFIITPEVDALSDEITDNILNWLALGDRNLVLVGNDPIWEKNGIYEKSNYIINKILDRLQSRIRLFPARNAFEALSSGCSIALPSYIPANTTSSYIQPIVTKAYGVADIRMYLKNYPNFAQLMPCNGRNDTLPLENIDAGTTANEIINQKCELPLKNLGDLRAEWIERCKDCQDRWLYYPVNWAYMFNTYQPPCCVATNGGFDWAHQEPIPLMVAGEYVTKTTTIPARPAVSGIRTIFKTIEQPSLVATFFNDVITPSSVSFIWSANSGNYTSLNFNDQNIVSKGLFYQPDIFEDRQSLLMANTYPLSETIQDKELITTFAHYCMEETYGSNSSKLIFIAGVETESQDILYSGQGDQNLNFYANLVSKNIDGEATIAQLGGWTQKTKFTDGYPKSFLKNLFRNVGNDVYENVLTILDEYDVCWVANPAGLPSQQELAEIKRWMNLPNKKLIITYDNTRSQLLIAKQISDLLNSKIKPLYLPVLDQYPIIKTKAFAFDPNHPVSQGWNSNTSITSLELLGDLDFYPLKNVDGTSSICFINQNIYDQKFVNSTYWNVRTGVTKVSFPAIPGSGYKIFITTISESPSETEGLYIGVSNISRFIDRDFSSRFAFDTDYNRNIGELYEVKTSDLVMNKPKTYSFNARVTEENTEIDVFIANNVGAIRTKPSNGIPKTARLLGISGVLIPIETVTIPQFAEVPDYQEYYLISGPEPEQIINETVLSPILNDNTQYCQDACADTLGHQSIADGPVIVAQEIEHFSQFLNGVNRSRITVISDSSLVQGQCMGDEFFRMEAKTVAFLRSLYPFTEWPDTNNGRQYTVMTKILSPERGSPQKYRAISQNSGIATLFGGGSGSPAPLNSFTNKDSKYDPAYVLRPKTQPWPEGTKQEIAELIKQATIKSFAESQYAYGATSLFSGIYNDKLYKDATMRGGMPEILKDTGHDYLDLDVFMSGYPGDLFGHSIALYKNKLIVGSPFSAYSQENIIEWDYIVNGGAQSGTQISVNGGAGSVYIFEKNNKGSGLHGIQRPWSFTQKLRPIGINVGSDNGNSIVTDKFGHSVSIDGDIIAVGAPGHDYNNHYINGSGAFIRRSFNPEFNIPSRNVYDLGYSGNRLLFNDSVNTVVNNGAIYTFENKIVDWPTKSQKWIFVEKLIQNDSSQSNLINDNFGSCVYIDKTNRTDADYSIIGGSKNSISSGILIDGAGSIFVNDIMLRAQSPAIQSPSAWIDASFFGESDASGQPRIKLFIQNNNDTNKKYYASGVIFSNYQGEIFVEASGQDPVLKGFAQHRPYIKSLDGIYVYGLPNTENLPLYINSTQSSSGNMSLFTEVDSIINVYNNLGLYTSSVTDIITNSPSGLHLYVHTPDPVLISNSGLTLFMASGIGLNSDSLNLRIRGK